MDIISQTRLFVDNMKLAHKVFSEGLGFKVINTAKTFCYYEMDSGCKILVYSDYDMWREDPQRIYLRIAVNKIDAVYQILKSAEEKIIITKKNDASKNSGPTEDIAILSWLLKSVSILSLETQEDDKRSLFCRDNKTK